MRSAIVRGMRCLESMQGGLEQEALREESAEALKARLVSKGTPLVVWL